MDGAQTDILTNGDPISGAYMALGGRGEKAKKRSAFVEFFSPKRIIWMFVVVNLLNYVDRGIIPGAPNQFQSFIHQTLKVPETAESTYLGLLQSVFVASFSVAVVIAGNLVHKFPPFFVMGVGLGIWCLAVFISGLGRVSLSFWVLVAGRALSGVGEASFQCIAPAFIEDLSPPGQKVLWLGIFFSSITVGTAGGYAYSAVVSTSTWGWDWAFYMEGIAMIPFVIICCFLPFRLKGSEKRPENDVSLRDEVETILSSPLFIIISLGYAAYCAVLAGLSTFGPTFFQGLQLFPSEQSASLHFSGIVAFAGAIGTPFGGWISDKLAGDRASREEVLSTCLRIMCISSASGMCCAITAAYCETKLTFLFWMGLAVMLLFLPTGCTTMAVMASVPNEMRSSAVALNILIMHVLGDVPSPVVIGMLKDHLAPRCNTRNINGNLILNPDCVKDVWGLRITLVMCLSWMLWTVIFWTLPLIFPESLGKPLKDEKNMDKAMGFETPLLETACTTNTRPSETSGTSGSLTEYSSPCY